MIQCIEEFASELQAAAFFRPRNRHRAHGADVDIELARTVDDSCSTVSEGGANAVSPDYERRSKTRRFEIVRQPVFDSTVSSQIRFVASWHQLSPVVSNAEDVGRVGVKDRERGPRLQGKHS